MSQEIWNYLDKQLSEQETADFLARLEKDPELQQQLESCRGIHQQLKSQEWEEPSLGFAQRVMQRIQKPVGTYQPLISPRLTRLFWTFVATAFGIALGLPQLLPIGSFSKGETPTWLSIWMEHFGNSGNFLLILTVLATTALAFIGMDRWFSQKSRNRPTD